jgi:hypothetical protein
LIVALLVVAIGKGGLPKHRATRQHEGRFLRVVQVDAALTLQTKFRHSITKRRVIVAIAVA